MPKLPALAGTSVFQHPEKKRLTFHPVGLGDAPRPGDNFQEHPPQLGHAWVEGDKLYLSESAKRHQREHPETVPLMIFNDGVVGNQVRIKRGLGELKKLRDNFWLQAGTTTTISGTLGGLAGAAGTGALNGMATGPKGAIAGAVVGIAANALELRRRRLNNGTTEKTLTFIDGVIDIYLEACNGNATHGSLKEALLRLEKESKTLGPGAISAVAELEMQLQNNGTPAIMDFMVDLQTARIHGEVVENRS